MQVAPRSASNGRLEIGEDDGQIEVREQSTGA
jgi:hypothetical protein